MKLEKPLIVQGDGTLLLDVHNPLYDPARDAISRFAELEKSPEHIHTYRITQLSLWNAAASGMKGEDILTSLKKWSRYPVQEHVQTHVGETISRYGKVRLLPYQAENRYFLEICDEAIRRELSSTRKIADKLTPLEGGFLIDAIERGTLKQELTALGYPVQDEIPIPLGEALPISLRNSTLSGFPLTIRNYQRKAAEVFWGGMKPGNGFGIVVLPCGAGKTVVGITVMSMLNTNTLILTTNVAAVHQWMDELLDKTEISEDSLGEYTGDKKEIKPVTIATYQILTWRPNRDSPFHHFTLFSQRPWGLVIYDEVHLLPAPIFRATAEIQAVRRLGLTATLIREDGKEKDVFSLVGPKRFDIPWKELESQGWIAEAHCFEIRIDLPENQKIPYAVAEKRKKYRIASENPLKDLILREILKNHRDDSILIIGQYITQLEGIASLIDVPIITGKTPNSVREEIYADFKRGVTPVLVVSKVANFAIDLPDASVAIQVSGTFGSRQEEAQRLGRILRPKDKPSYFYTIISRFTSEESFAANRQKFLTEQGYKYHIEIWEEQELPSISDSSP